MLGPTGAGKSSLAMQLATHCGLSIISADSRQVYKGFDIGTAKPLRSEREHVPHFGVDVVDPEHRYSAHAWAAAATEWEETAVQRGTPPLIVGGTGFYIRSLVRPLADVPMLESHRRTAIQKWLETLDVVELERWTTRLDPMRAKLGRTQRLRALETALLTGHRLSDAFDTPLSSPSRAVRYLVVDPGDSLASRIQHRVQAMLDAGWVDEVRTLMQRIPASAPAWLASGYAVIREHAEGHVTLATAKEQVVIETRQYAKRQRTWCRHQLTEGPVTGINPEHPDAFQQVLTWWNSAPATP